ncbi:MAG TPA: ABC transporter ATP-binding protein [Candidatus Binatia bacterium]|nr:ABC transporter ATP-binding protein [Candidatus Binatia bacterium]
MIRIDNLHLRYRTDRGEVHAVRGISLEVKQGQFYTLLGPSGCGKTTTLRSVAGLEIPDEGEISVGDHLVFSSSGRISVPPYKRDIGMVFQSYAIWPHLTVFENVAFPLREMRRRLSKGDLRQRVLQALALVQLAGLEDRPAPFLSGGQQQRLALARALVKEPRVLLLDEPLSNLDAKLREETRFELRELIKRLGITTLYVTHDQLEALTMSDVVAVMDQGRVIQEGTPTEIYQAPQQRFVANFIGLTNFLEGKVKELPGDGQRFGIVDTASGALKCVLPGGVALQDPVVIVVRPEDINLVTEPRPDQNNLLRCKVEAVVFMGEALECQAVVGAQKLRTKLHPSSAVRQGEIVALELPAERCRALRG